MKIRYYQNLARRKIFLEEGFNSSVMAGTPKKYWLFATVLQKINLSIKNTFPGILACCFLMTCHKSFDFLFHGIRSFCACARCRFLITPHHCSPVHKAVKTLPVMPKNFCTAHFLFSSSLFCKTLRLYITPRCNFLRGSLS